MDFGYISHSYNRVNPEDSVYVKIAARAIDLMRGAVAGNLTLDQLDKGMLEVNKQMIEAEKNEAMTAIDDNYPIWLVELLTKKYRQWHMWRLLCSIEAEHPEQFKSRKDKSEFKQLSNAGFDEGFIEACRDCLRELNASIE